MALESGKEGQAQVLARVIRIVFGCVAGFMLVAALANIVLLGHLTIITPFSFGALLTVAMAFLLPPFGAWGASVSVLLGAVLAALFLGIGLARYAPAHGTTAPA